MVRKKDNKTIYNNVYSHYRPPGIKSAQHHKTQWALHGLGVYTFVFTTNVAFGAALILCVSLLLQPVAFVHAQALEPLTPQPAVNDTVNEAVSADVSPSFDAVSEPMSGINSLEAVNDNGDDQSDIDNNIETQIDSSKSQSTDTSVNGEAESDMISNAVTTDSSNTNTLSSSVETVGATSTVTESVVIAANTGASQSLDPVNNETGQSVTSVASTTGTNTNQIPGVETSSPSTDLSTSSGAAATTDNSAKQSSTTTTITTTDTSAGGNVADVDSGSTTTISTESTVISTVQTDNVFAFNKNECTEVEDGSFYCQKISPKAMAENDLFAAPDATGDMEIYVIQNGEQMKITDNAVDDASPYYDVRSETIVWHRLIDDRYQIISYDIKTGTEQQITDTAVNNMEPTRNGDFTVWQRWVQNNWEIILRNGDQESQITNSIEHDIAPHIRGDLIIWNVRSSDGTQSLMTYDIGSEVFNEIKDTDGVSVSNPRMLVMYEAQYQNGDTVMKGFDLVTGEVIPIERIPRDLPTDIPNPETTGEVRALPTHPQLEEELSSDADLDTDEPNDNGVVYDDTDLVLNGSSTASTTVVQETEFDLDLRPLESQSGTTTDDVVIQQASIPDMVVTEFSAVDLGGQASSTQEN